MTDRGVRQSDGGGNVSNRERNGPHGPMLESALNWTCGLSPADTLECLDAATRHGFRLTDDGQAIIAMMACCETHRSRMGADYEHPMQSACGITGSYFTWPENYCHIDWGDESAALIGELALAQEVPHAD